MVDENQCCEMPLGFGFGDALGFGSVI